MSLTTWLKHTHQEWLKEKYWVMMYFVQQKLTEKSTKLRTFSLRNQSFSFPIYTNDYKCHLICILFFIFKKYLCKQIKVKFSKIIMKIRNNDIENIFTKKIEQLYIWVKVWKYSKGNLYTLINHWITLHLGKIKLLECKYFV